MFWLTRDRKTPATTANSVTFGYVQYRFVRISIPYLMNLLFMILSKGDQKKKKQKKIVKYYLNPPLEPSVNRSDSRLT